MKSIKQIIFMLFALTTLSQFAYASPIKVYQTKDLFGKVNGYRVDVFQMSDEEKIRLADTLHASWKPGDPIHFPPTSVTLEHYEPDVIVIRYVYPGDNDYGYDVFNKAGRVARLVQFWMDQNCNADERVKMIDDSDFVKSEWRKPAVFGGPEVAAALQIYIDEVLAPHICDK